MASTATETTPLPLDDPQLRAFLPLLYVAWADGELTEPEIGQLRERILAQPWLDPKAREVLGAWLDPGTPPSARDLSRVLATIRASAANLRDARRHTLAELGLEMAALTENAPGDPDVTRAAVEELERALGLEEPAASRFGERELISGAPSREPREKAVEAPGSDVDVAALRDVLDGPRAIVRRRIREFLEDPAHRADPDLSSAAYRELVLRWARELADLGVGALAYPGVTTGDEVRGLGDFLVAFETLAFGDLSLWTKVGVQFGLFGGSIYFLGSDAQRTELLPAVARGELLGCFAMSELGHGSNVADLETTATWVPERDAFVIHTPREGARKEWIGNAAAHARLATVFAQLIHDDAPMGVHAFLVPIRDDDGAPTPGVRIGDGGHKMGLNGVDNGRLWFDQVEIPRTAMLSRFAEVTPDGRYTSGIPSASRRFFTMLGTLVAGRVSVGAAAVGAAKVGLAVAIRYGTARTQFGPPDGPEAPLLSYPAHRRKLLVPLAGTYALHFAAAEVRQRYLARTDEDAREVEALAAGFKAYATWHAVDALQTSREACGGQGYLSVNRIASLRRDADVFTTFEGDNTVLLQLVAKSLLSGFRQELASDRYLGVLRHLARKGVTRVTEKNPLAVRRTDDEHIRSRDLHEAALRYRETALLEGAARRIRRRLGDGMDAYAAFVDVQDHLVALALAHVEGFVHRTFAAAADDLRDDAGVRAPLERLVTLYGLSRLDAHAGWFLENGYVEPSKSRAIRKAVTALLREVAADARPLVDAFGIPGAALAAPIAFADPADPAW